MHQSTTPSLSQTIWPRWASRQFLSLLIVQTLLPMTLGYSLSSEAVVMRQLRRWKGLWRRSLKHWNTRGHPWGLPEVFGSVQQGHCRRRRLLRRRLEFHACTINKSAHKKIWKHRMHLVTWRGQWYQSLLEPSEPTSKPSKENEESGDQRKIFG